MKRAEVVQWVVLALGVWIAAVQFGFVGKYMQDRAVVGELRAAAQHVRGGMDALVDIARDIVEEAAAPVPPPAEPAARPGAADRPTHMQMFCWVLAMITGLLATAGIIIAAGIYTTCFGSLERFWGWWYSGAGDDNAPPLVTATTMPGWSQLFYGKCDEWMNTKRLTYAHGCFFYLRSHAGERNKRCPIAFNYSLRMRVRNFRDDRYSTIDIPAIIKSLAESCLRQSCPCCRPPRLTVEDSIYFTLLDDIEVVLTLHDISINRAGAIVEDPTMAIVDHTFVGHRRIVMCPDPPCVSDPRPPPAPCAAACS
jgi:hypothetical protein